MCRMQHTFRLVLDLVRKDLRARYRTSSMGFFWSVINPLVMVVLFTFVFSELLQVKPPAGIKSFAAYVFSGFLPWFAMQESLFRCASSVLDNSNLVKTVRFPIAILPLYLVISGLINMMIGIVILLPLSAYTQGNVSPVFLLIIPVVVIQAMFCVGMGWLLATLQVFIRDTAQVLGVALVVWMYVTPIFWPPEAVPAGYGFLLEMNPMHHLLSIYRSLLVEFSLPSMHGMVVFGAVSAAVFYVGFGVVTRRSRDLVDLV